ncbi:MAG: sulfatase-like hydrolase/transferase [Cyclobacteriaceae bacterium]
MDSFRNVLSSLCLIAAIISHAQTQPNVLVIYTDDHRYSGVHALGGMQVKTPNMDQLAAEGITFTNAFLMGAFSGATCIPSRAMLLTGRNLFELKGAGHQIPTTHTTMGEVFHQEGYNTYMVGKWHQDNASLARSFENGARVMSRGVYLVDHFRMPLWDWEKDGNYQKEDGYLITYDENRNEIRRPLTQDDQRGPTGTEADGPHTSEVFAQAAIDYIQNYKKKQPFMMYLAFHAPHDPRQAPQRFKDMYPIDSIILTPSYLPQHPFDNGHIVLRDEELAPWPRTPEIAKQQLSDYYAIISHLDEQIGAVIQALKESGQYQNTLIVFAGDSGLGVGNHGLLGKQNIYDEDGVHIPFILSGGAIPQKGHLLDAFCYTHDILPTVLDLVNIDPPTSVTGRSLVPAINGDANQIRSYTYHAYRQHQRAYREGDFKLIEYVRAKDASKKDGEFISGSRVTQLFNIREDPWETLNLADFPDYKAKVSELRVKLKSVASQLNDNNETVLQSYDFWDYYE